ncbi:MAG: M48 family metallopeptidase, partial [Patescibacteria group bacterium]
IKHFNKNYGFKFGKITIKAQKTKWGSCSKKGNLNFNFKIMVLPKDIRDYIIVHELCHIKEQNHSNKFWNLVAMTIPDYLSIKKQLIVVGLQIR